MNELASGVQNIFLLFMISGEHFASVLGDVPSHGQRQSGVRRKWEMEFEVARCDVIYIYDMLSSMAHY